MTPEGKVKKKIKETLHELGCYYSMVVTGGFGNSGTPDFLICCSGIFVGIECKANGNKPTALQRDHIEKINECGGVAFVVNETNVDNLKSILTELMKCQKRNEK